MSKVKTTLPRLPARVESSLAAVTNRISSITEKDFGEHVLFHPSVHILKRRGKYLRPALVLLGAHAIGEDPARFVDLAIAAELFHVSSLIHDDIIDGDKTRRGVKAVHVKYGTESAILAGDALIAKAIGMSADYGKDVLRSMSKAAMDMCAGEALDSHYQKRGKVPTVSEYTRLAKLKSASLISTCCSIAAIYHEDKSAKNLGVFGENMGIAFQMRDDILDYGSETGVFGRGKKVRFHPNIVSSILNDAGISGSDAVSRAKALNNDIINTAVSAIKDRKTFAMLSSMAEKIRV